MNDERKATYHYKVLVRGTERVFHTAVDYDENETTGTLTLRNWEGFRVASFPKGDWREIEMVGEPSAE